MSPTTADVKTDVNSAQVSQQLNRYPPSVRIPKPTVPQLPSQQISHSDPTHPPPSYQQSNMLRSCLPDLTYLSSLFSLTSTPPLAPTPQQPSCDLTSLPYSSWHPPSCPQNCEGVCRHLPVGSDTRINGRLVSRPRRELAGGETGDAERAHTDAAAQRPAAPHLSDPVGAACAPVVKVGHSRPPPALPSRSVYHSAVSTPTTPPACHGGDAGDAEKPPVALQTDMSVSPTVRQQARVDEWDLCSLFDSDEDEDEDNDYSDDDDDDSDTHTAFPALERTRV
ncbi:hypothetical protein C7974DRAFT_447119 [Boeremia exigua]|uniref:uncharacterized protein n=1 Tax=Boeremia exigua TaxID=749465 RepID=UPI001E8CE432|nr:uncharacterized protein C7974DRAFT_447119 [Boeremia exigua]KAH6642524.1 hypothetical protein C7974DRAFT_447119 [Boeremia exigua]